MGEVGLTDEQLNLLYECISNERVGLSVQYASAALFLFDYCLTVYDELRFVWRPRRVSLSSVSYLMARYPAFAGTAISLLPNSGSVTLQNISVVLRLVAIVASEFIVAVRTWAIWERNRKILYVLIFTTVFAVIPVAGIIAKDIVSSKLGPSIAPNIPESERCRVVVSPVQQAYIVPYIMTIIYEGVTLSLSFTRIMRWRKSIPETIRTPLIDTLWKDGVLYFSFMLVLGFLNIGLVIQSSLPQLRGACAQLQMALHSMLATRIVLHLASSHNPRDIAAPGSSIVTDTHIQFTTRFETGGSTTQRSRLPMSRHRYSSDAQLEED